MKLQVIAVSVFAFWAVSVAAQDEPSRTLFTNVHVFDGMTDGRIENASVLVEGNLIKSVSENSIDAAGATVIDGGGRTLMPGLIDSHVHLSLYTPFAASRQNIDPYMAAILAAERYEAMLLRGFTTVRDLGGYTSYLNKGQNEGFLNGPRLYGAGRFISQTSGHGDMRAWNDPHPNIEGNGVTNYWEQYHTTIADGPDEVLRAGRISLRNGAHFLKIFTSGGVTSEFDPLHMTQYTPEEVQAAVQAADQWKTYVTAHAFTDEAVRLAVENGAKGVEHAPLITEDTAKMLEEKGIFVELNVATILGRSLEELEAVMSPASFAKVKIAIEGQLVALEAIAKYPDTKVVYGSDLVSPWGQATLQAEQALHLAEFPFYAEYFGNFRALRAATGTGGELAALTGPNNPWQEGPLGVIQEGAYADILLVDGNPLEDIMIMTSDENFDLIMKDGVIYKNELN